MLVDTRLPRPAEVTIVCSRHERVITPEICTCKFTVSFDLPSFFDTYNDNDDDDGDDDGGGVVVVVAGGGGGGSGGGGGGGGVVGR